MSNGVGRQSVPGAIAQRTRLPLVAVAALSLMANLLVLTGPLFMLQVYDRVLSSRSVPTLVALFALVAAVYGFLAGIDLIRSRMATRFAAVFDEALSARAFRTALRQALTARTDGRSDPTRDVDIVRQYLAGPGPLALFDLPWLPLYLLIVFLFHPLLGWLATGGAAIATVLLVVNERLAVRPSGDAARAQQARGGFLEDARSNAEPVFAMGMQDELVERWTDRTSAQSAVQGRAGDVGALYASVTKSFRLLLQSAVLALGAWLVIGGELSAGLMIAASIVTSRALAPVEQVVAHWRSLANARQALRRLRPLLDSEADAAPSRLSLPSPHRRLDLRGYATGPSPDTPPLVSGVSFTLEAGDALGVLGLSGSGKTSLVRGLVGVWPTLAGEMRLDGSEAGHYDPVSLGRTIGYLPQNAGLMDGTVAENIARFRPDASSKAILAAAHEAGVHDIIANLPQGYETPIGPRGAVLSAGQRQRIGLARALFGEPFLVVLDEPNANLDHPGDTALTAAIEAAKRRGAVVIVVAHRPSAIAACDKLVYLAEGRQVAFGGKAEVLKRIASPPSRIADARAHA